MKPPRSRLVILCLALLAASSAAALTSPKDHFGFAIGDDYHLATYTQTEAYFKKLAAESDRVKLVDIGPTEEGRREYMVIVSSPANLAKLEHYREISQKLARAEGLTDDEARALAAEGKAIVWIDGGLHATETVGTHQLIESVWTFASRTDPTTLRILNDCIILFTHANPDGQELISSWYLRRPVAEKRVTDLAPRLYEKYIGHDNNRDFFLMNMKETTNMARQLFIDWIPQIVYNHHQSGPPGTIIAGPPYRDPFNYVYDPLLVTSLDAVGAAMHSRFMAEDKPGSTMRGGSVFSTWWNGGLRTTTYFHNQIGLLTEIVGSPTPMEIPLLPARQIPNGTLPYPVAPQTWHYRQSIDYSLTANYAVLDYASRQRDELLYNIYRMGKNSIRHGSADHWTNYPSRVDAMRRAYEEDKKTGRKPAAGTDASIRYAEYAAKGIPAKYYELLRQPGLRDARGYIIPSDQPDFATAVKFVNALLKAGIRIEEATNAFEVAGKKYPAGSYVVKTDQAFRPHVIDLFEPQDHPNDFKYEGGPPTAPYDSAGWTLAFLMGVKFDRVLDGFSGPFARIPYGELQAPPAGRLTGTGAGWLVSHQANNSFLLANRLLKAGADAYWLKAGIPGDAAFGPGTLYVPAQGAAKVIVEKAVADLGLAATAVAAKPAGDALKLAPMRIALWDNYGGSIPSGWTRWLFEQFEFPFQVVYPPNIDAGDLRSKYDVIVFVEDAIPLPKAMHPKPEAEYDFDERTPKPEDVPEEFRGWMGKITEEKSVPQLKKFLEAGGTVITVGSSTNLAYHLDLPIRNALVELDKNGQSVPLPSAKYYVPGSVLRAAVDATAPLAWGMEKQSDLYFDNSPVFNLKPEAAARGVRPVVWFDSAKPLHSGWAWGQAYLENGIEALEAPVGAGKLYLLAPEVTFRGQTHGTFKLLFNGLYLSTAKATN